VGLLFFGGVLGLLGYLSVSVGFFFSLSSLWVSGWFFILHTHLSLLVPPPGLRGCTLLVRQGGDGFGSFYVLFLFWVLDSLVYSATFVCVRRLTCTQMVNTGTVLDTRFLRFEYFLLSYHG